MALLGAWAGAALSAELLPKADGFRGIWYANQPTEDEYRYKYSGGLATYPQQHVPIAIYSGVAQMTFFVFGGRPADRNELSIMIAYYDHALQQVSRPRILLRKETDDAHDNPALALDEAGHLWVFSNAHGRGRPSYVHRSRRPYTIDQFDPIELDNFSYGQPWWVPDRGLLFLHTRYTAPASGQPAQRALHWMTRPFGRDWTAPRLLAHIEMGDYQVSWRHDKRVGTAFDFHPAPVGLNARANLYYAETADFGDTWITAGGAPVTAPIQQPDHPALVYNSLQDGLLVYLKDLNYDAEGHPVILYLTSRGYEPGPETGPRTWWTARWTGSAWVRHPITTSDHNYDHGSLYVEPNGTWRLIAPTAPGPQAHCAGGEMMMWRSRNQGKTWRSPKPLTSHSWRNHTYARRPFRAHPDFYALWADGNAREPSESFLYFTDREGSAVWRLPPVMQTDLADAELAWRKE